MGRSPTINVGHIDRLVVEGKSSAANDGHPHEGMSSARATNVIVVDHEPVCREATFSAIHTPSRKEQEGHQDRAAEAGPDRGRDVAGSARQPFRRTFCLAPTTGRKRSPSPAHSPRLCAALSPTRSADNGCVRRISPSASPNSSRGKFATLRRPPLRSGPSGAGRPGRAFLCRTEGNALAMGQRPPAQEKGSPKWLPTAPSPPPSARPARP